jgi:sec-independent protein translocase protein TatB
MGARGFITKTLLDDDDSFLTDLESSAKDVTGAVRGTSAQISGRAPKNPPRPSEVPTAQESEAPAAQEEERVELPQQDEVGQSRDWGDAGNYDDTM